MKLGNPVAALPLALALSTPALAQAYSSGSDGSDGALTFPPNAGVIEFDPTTFTPPLDADGDQVFHFTSITIPAGTTVRLTTRRLREGLPVYWLSSGDVTIAGVLDLNGENGHDFNAPFSPSFAGAGGWSGGVGGVTGRLGTRGNGPGGGKIANGDHGGGAGHLTVGGGGGLGGDTYGNDLLIPLWGGSGGGGGCVGGNFNPSGGGAGGGAIVIASSSRVLLSGTITARGGTNGSSPNCYGGGGSGGAVRLVAPIVEGAGSIDVSGGASNYSGAPGRVRIEAFKLPSTPTTTPGQSFTRGAPRAALPPAGAPVIKVLRVGGVDVSMTPSGSFAVPDVVIAAPGPVTLELETRGIPAGTVLQLAFQPEAGAQFSASSSAVVVNAGVGTATASAAFPSGFTRLFVSATWNP